MIFAKNFARNYAKKNNTWNLKRLVNETIVPATQCIILEIVGFQSTPTNWCSTPKDKRGLDILQKAL